MNFNSSRFSMYLKYIVILRIYDILVVDYLIGTVAKLYSIPNVYSWNYFDVPRNRKCKRPFFFFSGTFFEFTNLKVN